MKKALKRVLSIFLVAIIIAGSIPFVNFAETTTGTLKVHASGIYVMTAEVTNLPAPYANGTYTAYCGNKSITINANQNYSNVTHGLYDGPHMRTMNYLFNTDLGLTHEQRQQVAWKILHVNDYVITDTYASTIWTNNFSGKVDADFPSLPNGNYNKVVFYANAGSTIQPIFVIITKLVKVTFDPTGGSPDPNDQVFAHGGTALKPLEDPQKEGFKFDYWTLNDEEYEFATPVKSDITLVAHYTPIPEPTPQVTVTFDTNGGSTAPANQTFDKGLTATEPADPSKEGFEFDYWTLNGVEYVFTTPVNEDITLIAHYTEEGPTDPEPTPQVTVTFDTNGGSTAPANQTFNKGLTATEPADPSKEGFEFDYWTLNGVEYVFTTPVNEDITLIAHYTEKTTEPPVNPTEPPVIPTEPQGPQGTVTVNHITTEGNELAPGFTFNGTVGTNYATSVRTFDGYSLTEVPSNASGSFTSAPITITYVYADDNIEVIEDEDNALSAVTEAPTTEATSSEELTTETTIVEEQGVIIDEVVPLGDALPKTGQASPELFYGIGSIITAAGVLLRKNRK